MTDLIVGYACRVYADVDTERDRVVCAEHCHKIRPAGRHQMVIDFSRLSDDELLAATRQQPEAFGVFYERHAAVILRFLARATGNRDVALDLTAEVFAAALAATGRYRSREAPARDWLFGIARNKLAAIRRGHARADAARRRLGIPRLEFTDAALERIEEILDAQGAGYLNGMRDLTPREREAVRARVIEEREYSEVAAASGTSEAAIRKRVSRGLAKLAQRRTGGT